MSATEDFGALGSDLKLYDYFLGADLEKSGTGDIVITSNSMNLAQALLHRIRTVKGELTELGHPDYGSNIFDFIGQPNNWVTRERLRLAIRDTIRQERRVKEIIGLTVKPRLESVPIASSEQRGTKEVISLETDRFSDQVEERLDDGFQPPSSQQHVRGSDELLNSVDVDIVIVPVGANAPVKISFPFNLEVA